jgi:hypothetical protein
MQTANQIEIQLSKSKLVLLFLGGLVFVAIGIWFIVSPPQISNPVLGSPGKIFVVGVASILFFGIGAFFLLKKLGDKSPGLILSNQGIFDNASAVSVGFIPWTDIVEIRETKVANQTFVNIIVKNPQHYIDKQTSAFKKKLIQLNYNQYGTVIGISATALKCDYKELKAMLDKKFDEVKNKTV